MNGQSAEKDAPAEIPQFRGMEMFEHYQGDGYLLLVTSDATAIHFEPGDFIVKRMWSTAVAPYVWNRARPAPPAECDGSFGCDASEHEEGCFAPYVLPPAKADES